MDSNPLNVRDSHKHVGPIIEPCLDLMLQGRVDDE